MGGFTLGFGMDFVKPKDSIRVQNPDLRRKTGQNEQQYPMWADTRAYGTTLWDNIPQTEPAFLELGI